MSLQHQGSVAILLATHDGERFLPAQLDSIAAQTHGNWAVWASDDASTDRTRLILEDYRKCWAPGKLTIVSGPAAGFVENFRSLTGQTGIDADFLAYADQDDVWEADKLERALRWLGARAAGHALYCSRTILMDERGHDSGYSPLCTRPASFANALVQNLAGGNTMVFTRPALELLRLSLPASRNVVIHDWWTYLLISGAGGEVYYDPVATVRYRQHGANLVGANVRASDRLGNLRHIWRGRMREWNDRHIEALQAVRAVLTGDNRAILDRFSAARQAWLVPRMIGLHRSGVYRQTSTGRIGLVLAALLNRV